jgi:hypothetical protein
VQLLVGRRGLFIVLLSFSHVAIAIASLRGAGSYLYSIPSSVSRHSSGGGIGIGTWRRLTSTLQQAPVWHSNHRRLSLSNTVTKGLSIDLSPQFHLQPTLDAIIQPSLSLLTSILPPALRAEDLVGVCLLIVIDQPRIRRKAYPTLSPLFSGSNFINQTRQKTRQKPLRQSSTSRLPGLCVRGLLMDKRLLAAGRAAIRVPDSGLIRDRRLSAL